MTAFFLKLKHHFKLVWSIIEWLNGKLFSLFYARSFETEIGKLLENSSSNKYKYKRLEEKNMEALSAFFERQPKESYRFFNPHSFDSASLKRMFDNPSFIMMGVTDGDKLVGYFFLRCFINKKCFIGRIVDAAYQKQGIANGMNDIMYKAAWRNGFQCLTTISKQNEAIVNLHKKEANTVILRELPNNYLLVEMKQAQNDAKASLFN